MPFIATPNGIKIELNAIQNGVPVVNVLHTKSNVPIDADLLASVTSTVSTWYFTNRALFHPSYVLQNVTATDISVADGIQNIGVIVSGGAGTATGEPAAANAAVVASLRSARTGRSYRGRMYFGGLAQSSLDTAQNILPDAATVYATAVMNLVDALIGIGQVLSVLSLVANKVARVAGVLTEIISIIVDTKIDSQRRRTAN